MNDKRKGPLMRGRESLSSVFVLFESVVDKLDDTKEAASKKADGKEASTDNNHGGC